MDYPFYNTWTAQNKAVSFNIKNSKGCYINSENKKIFDFSSTSFHIAFGHSPDFLISTLKQQLDHIITASPKAVFDLKLNATNKLLNYLGFKKGKIFYTTSGAESIENALKMARQISAKNIILAREDSYHGATLGALSVTGDWRNTPHQTIENWTVRIPSPQEDPDLSKTEKIIQEVGPDKIAAFCLETITGGNGVFIPTQTWWDGIDRLKKKYNLFLILDEIVCGFYRTGKPFGFQHFRIKADFISLSKIISAGVIPFGALYTTKEISDYYEFNTLSCGLTNYANPLGLSAMSSIIDYLGSHSQEIDRLIKTFELELQQIKNNSHVLEIRSIGLLAAIKIKGTTSFEKLLNAGLYTMVKDQNTIILAPPFVATTKDLQEAFKTLNHFLENL